MALDAAAEGRFASWVDEFHFLTDQVGELLRRRSIFEALDDELLDHQDSPDSDIVIMTLRVMYVESQCALIRRLVDESGRKRHRSLWHLIGDMADNPGVLSRERYLASYGDDKRGRSIGERRFDEIAGRPASHVSQRRLKRLRHRVKCAGTAAKRHADEVVAHNSHEPALATWGALGASIDELAQCMHELGAMLQRPPTWPSIGVGWKAVFRRGLFSRG